MSSENVSEALQRFMLSELHFILHSTVNHTNQIIPLSIKYDTALPYAKDKLSEILKDAAMAHNDIIFNQNIVDTMLSKILSVFFLPMVEELVLAEGKRIIAIVLKKLDPQIPAAFFFDHVYQISASCIALFVLDKTKYFYHLNYNDIKSMGISIDNVITRIALDSMNKFFETQTLIFRV
jgi:hypothetical protein